MNSTSSIVAVTIVIFATMLRLHWVCFFFTLFFVQIKILLKNDILLLTSLKCVRKPEWEQLHRIDEKTMWIVHTFQHLVWPRYNRYEQFKYFIELLPIGMDEVSQSQLHTILTCMVYTWTTYLMKVIIFLVLAISIGDLFTIVQFAIWFDTYRLQFSAL